MPGLPARFAGLIPAFAPLFVHRSWCHARILLLCAIQAPGRRTGASLLRIMGRAHERRFVNFHRVLNRAATQRDQTPAWVGIGATGAGWGFPPSWRDTPGRPRGRRAR
jgi:hypothetical protein